MCKFESILITSSREYWTVRTWGRILSPILTCKCINWFSLWESVWKPDWGEDEHLRTAPQWSKLMGWQPHSPTLPCPVLGEYWTDAGIKTSCGCSRSLPVFWGSWGCRRQPAWNENLIFQLLDLDLVWLRSCPGTGVNILDEIFTMKSCEKMPLGWQICSF
jgi:hypothetical protein